MYLIILLHILYGCTFTISKILVKYANPIFVIGIRMIIAGALLSAVSLIFLRKKTLHLDRLSILYLLQIAVFGIYFPYVLRYWALKFLPVTKTALMYNLSPFAAFFFSYLFFRERATLKKWLGLIIGFAGILPILMGKQTATETALHSFGFFSWPELAMLASVSCFSYGWVVTKKLVLHNNISPPQINGINMLIGGVLALFTSFALEPSQHIQHPNQFFMWLALIILITNLICFNLYAALLRTYSATLLSLGGLLAPVSAAITSWLYFGEKLTWEAYLSGGCVIIGFIVFYSEELRLEKQISTNDEDDLESQQEFLD